MQLASPEADAYEPDEEEFKALGKAIISFIYALKSEEFPEKDFLTIATQCINCLKHAVRIESDFSTECIGELLGIAKSFILYAIPDFEHQPPTKIPSSQQAIMEPVPIKPTRRVNAVAKNRKVRKNNSKRRNPERQPEDSYRSYGVSENTVNTLQLPTYSIFRTSDSDFSDNEHNREFANRHKQSKLRLVALGLISHIAATVEKKILFGYWHSLFSTEESSSPTLVNNVLKDTSPRCKVLALQTIIQLLRNSKPFLVQAENKEKSPATFTPFSVTLGNMITFTYEKLTQALIKEGDLTVLTQILKCISIFITVTPFHRLRPGIVTGFIKYARHLTWHKDPTVKDSAA